MALIITGSALTLAESGSPSGSEPPLARLHVAPLTGDLYTLWLSTDPTVRYQTVRFASRTEPAGLFQVFAEERLTRYEGLGVAAHRFQTSHPVTPGERRAFRAYVKVASAWFASNVVAVEPPLDGDTLRVASVRTLHGTESQAPNLPANVFDGEISTRWSAEGNRSAPVRLEIELDRWRRLDTLRLATYLSGERRWRFRLDAYRGEPPDEIGSRLIPLLPDTTTSGRTRGFEAFALPPVQVKRLVLTGYGNTQNDWNSVTEIRLTAGGR